jgi:hypothetical protein
MISRVSIYWITLELLFEGLRRMGFLKPLISHDPGVFWNLAKLEH